MINNIDLLASSKVSKPNSSNKKTDSRSDFSGKANSFRDSLKEASRSMQRDNGSIRRELANKSESKLRNVSKSDSAIDEKNGQKDEAKEKQTEKIAYKMEEMLMNLQELANLQQLGEVPAEKHTLLLDGVKEAFQDLTAFQNKLAKLGDTQLESEITELKALLDGVLSELKADSGLANGNSSDFMQKLESVIEKTLSKLETVPNASIESDIVQSDSNNTDVSYETSNSNAALFEEVLATQGQNKADSSMTESRQTGEDAENRNSELKVEAVAANKTINQESATKTGLAEDGVTEEEKNALNGKTHKVSVENRKQDAESGTGEEAPKEARMAANTKQNKPANGDMNTIRPEQTVIEDNSEVIINQTEAPKTQTVSRTEIINQIVKKAEIILTDAQSEMRMQLEPENLGKLNLKIAVERGLITAKFTAESYEVKQIIESSFNELKDMLQEQGLEVQNFSVSVGQDNREYNNDNAFHQWKETVKLNSSIINKGGYEGYLNTEGGTAAIANPYSVHNGEFDHSA